MLTIACLYIQGERILLSINGDEAWVPVVGYAPNTVRSRRGVGEITTHYHKVVLDGERVKVELRGRVRLTNPPSLVRVVYLKSNPTTILAGTLERGRMAFIVEQLTWKDPAAILLLIGVWWATLANFRSVWRKQMVIS